jgi:phage terminase large subunit GpA-like protein
MKAARVGYTEGIIGNAIGFFIDQDPCPQLVVQPTVDDAKGWSKDNLTPLIEETPRLAEKVRDQKSRNSGNTVLAKRYPGGSLKAIGANSPRGFRRVTVRVVYFDEVDGYPVGGRRHRRRSDLAREEARADLRQPKDHHRIDADAQRRSRIETAYIASSQGSFYVACPHCGHEQKLVWKNITWDKETLEDGTSSICRRRPHYVCANKDAAA